MKKNLSIRVIMLALAVAFVGCGICQGDEMKTDAAAKTAAPVKVNNTICPVLGIPINMQNPVTVEYNGKIYNVCCSMCFAKFKTNPEKYSKIAEDQARGLRK